MPAQCRLKTAICVLLCRLSVCLRIRSLHLRYRDEEVVPLTERCGSRTERLAHTSMAALIIRASLASHIAPVALITASAPALRYAR